MTRLVALVALIVMSSPPFDATARAARVTCPDGEYVIVSGGDLVADEPGVPPVLGIVGREVTLIGGCPLARGRAKPTKRGLRVTGRWRDCGEFRKLKLKALVAPGCETLEGTIRGRGVAPVTVIGQRSGGSTSTTLASSTTSTTVGNGSSTSTSTSTSTSIGGGTTTTSTSLPPNVGVTITSAYCTKDACSCGEDPGFDYHLQAEGTVTGPVGTELRVNASGLQGGQLDCGGWSPIDGTVNPSCNTIKCCRRGSGQPETTNWHALEAIDLPCLCPSAPGPLEHNYDAIAQLGSGTPAEALQTTSPCP